MDDLVQMVTDLLAGPLLGVVLVIIGYFVATKLLATYFPIFGKILQVKREARMAKLAGFLLKAGIVVAVIAGLGVFAVDKLGLSDLIGNE